MIAEPNPLHVQNISSWHTEWNIREGAVYFPNIISLSLTRLGQHLHSFGFSSDLCALDFHQIYIYFRKAVPTDYLPQLLSNIHCNTYCLEVFPKPTDHF